MTAAGRAGAGGAPPVIALVSDAIHPYHRGGKETRIRYVAAGLAARGLEVHVYTMNWWHGPAHKVEGGVHYHALCRYYPLYTDSRRSILEAVMFALACLRLLRCRYDLIEADHMPHLPLIAVRLVASLRRVPLVSTWHEYWGLEYWRQYLGKLGVVAARIEQLAMRAPDRVITPSPETAARLIAQGVAPERLDVVPNGIDLPAVEAAAPAPERFDLLYVGRLLQHKRVDLLIDGVALLAASGTPLTCAIVGDGPERGRLEAQVSRLGLASRVRLLGHLPGEEEVFGLMKSARLFVLPSVREGYGVVVAEAIACGLPVVTTDHPDNHAQALVEEGVTGYLCSPTATSLAAAVCRGLEVPPGLRPASRAAARFDWQASVEAIAAIFDGALLEHAGGRPA